MVNALENGAEEGRDYLRKASGSWVGNPGNWNILVPGGKENK